MSFRGAIATRNLIGDMPGKIGLRFHPRPGDHELNPVEHLWEYIRENYLKNAYWLSMEALETAIAPVLKKITDCSKMIQSLVRFHWAII